MKITDVKIHQPAGLLRILTDAGVEGWCLGVSEAAAYQVQSAFRDALIDQDPIDRERLYQELVRQAHIHRLPPPVWGCVDVALWDLGGKAIGLPVYRLIGGFRTEVPAYKSGRSLPDATGFAQDALQAMEEGFLGYKDRCDHGVEGTIKVARAIREAVGPDFYLMHDGGRRYTDAGALRVGRGLKGQDYHWFEEPLHDPNLLRLKRLSDALDVPIVAGEHPSGGACGVSQFLALQAVDRVRAGLPWCGGITDLLKRARLTEAFGINCEVASADGMWGFAHAHVIGAVKNCDFFEARKAGSQGGEPLIQNPLVIEGGFLTVPQGPGLGLELDWGEVERRTEKII